MAFYGSIQTLAKFRHEAAATGAQSFQDLSASADWKTAGILPSIERTVRALERNKGDWHQVIKDLVHGPRENMATLAGVSELNIVRAYQNDGLGHLWASLAPLLVNNRLPLPSSRNLRDRNPSVASASHASSAGDSLQSPTPSSGNSNVSSIGFHEIEWAPLLEDMTVRFASLFIRHILNYCQPLGKTSPLIQYRDAREKYEDDASPFRAIDDGGMQLFAQGGNKYQVAIVEAKRTFQTIENGTPTISDELLAQMVGEALGVIALKSSIFQNQVFIILAIKHYVKIFDFSVTEDFMSTFKTMDPTATAGKETYLAVDSTAWFDATEEKSRLKIVSHVMALVECADEVVAPTGSPDL
ncbi:hypothetical protein V8C35DRAFT_276308 [Trichoderma chlorosporum]